MMKNDIQASVGKKGEEITFKCIEAVRPRDKVYKIVES
jgi:hypothetical protein